MICRIRALRRDERGYIAILVAFMTSVMLCMCALTIDVGHWYVVGSQTQKAADAAALGGVPNLPGNQSAAFSTAQLLAKQNGFANGVARTSVATAMGDQPSRLRVTVTRTVDNFFGPLFGIPQTTITRTAMADFVGPLPMGSPCNAFSGDPEPGTTRSANCNNTGDFWANVGSPSSAKVNGDAFQSNACAGGEDSCSGTNKEYDADGYYYVVTLKRAVANLRFEAFDPAYVEVNNLCDKSWLTGAAGTRYEKGSTSRYCTGDARFSGSGTMATQFTVRQAGPLTTYWDPRSYNAIPGCTTTFAGAAPTALPSATSTVGKVFRQWVKLCTTDMVSAPAGQYMIQVKTNGLGTDGTNEHNRFGLRVYSTTDSSAKDTISVAGFAKMAIFANLPSAQTTFHLARVPSTAAGQVLSVKLYDVGDVSSGASGTIKVLDPSNNGLTGCTGTGVITGALATCEVTASTAFNGKWQTISVPIPKTYTCTDSDPTKCWFKIRYSYSGSQPNDATSWSAALDGNPVRLVE